MFDRTRSSQQTQQQRKQFYFFPNTAVSLFPAFFNGKVEKKIFEHVKIAATKTALIWNNTLWWCLFDSVPGWSTFTGNTGLTPVATSSMLDNHSCAQKATTVVLKRQKNHWSQWGVWFDRLLVQRETEVRVCEWEGVWACGTVCVSVIPVSFAPLRSTLVSQKPFIFVDWSVFPSQPRLFLQLFFFSWLWCLLNSSAYNITSYRSGQSVICCSRCYSGEKPISWQLLWQLTCHAR